MTSPGPAGNARTPPSVGGGHAWVAPRETKRPIPRTPEDIVQLNSSLRGELSAVEIYDRCLAELSQTATLTAELERLKGSHTRRVRLLSERVVELGGHPASGSGAWGVLASLAERGANLSSGVRGTLRALKAGERHGSAAYRRALRQLSPDSREFIAKNVLAEQLHTEARLSALEQHLET